MYPTEFPHNPPDKFLSGAVSSSGNVYSRSASGPKFGNATFYGRYAIPHPDTQPVYSAGGLLPGMSLTRDFFPPGRFGQGVSSVGNVSRNLPLLDQPEMASAFSPYHTVRQGLSGLGMSSGHLTSDWSVTSTRPADEPGGLCQSASSGKMMSKADTSESNSRQASLEPETRRKRTIYPKWKVQQLNKAFQRCAYLTNDERSFLASELLMTEEQVKSWFQNKRTTVKRRSKLDGEENSVQYIRPSRSVPGAFGDRQQMASFLWQGFSVQHKYTLLRDRKEISSTMAKSAVEALQEMLVEFRETPRGQFSRSAADCCQSRLPQPELPVTTSHTITRKLTKDDVESDSSDLIDP